MSQRIVPITFENWPQWFPLVLHFVVRAVEQATDEWDVGDVDRHIMNGNLLAWVVVDAKHQPLVFIAGEFVHYPRFTSFNVLVAAGQMSRCKKEIEQLFQFVRIGGAQRVEARCTASRARLFRRFGFTKIQEFVRRAL